MPSHSSTRPVVVLVGPPGAGKTTVGRLLASKLGVDFHDTDEAVEQTAGTTIPELFRTLGEEHFRALEHRAVTTELAGHTGVLALGGGAVMDPATREALRDHMVVFLDVDTRQAVRRVGRSGNRPLLAGDPSGKFDALMRERRAVYEAVATTVCVTTDRRPAEVAAQILQALAARGGALARIHVSGPAGYDVVVGRDLDAEVAAMVGPDATRVLVLHPGALTDRAESLRTALEGDGRTAMRHTIPDAEQAKTLDVVAECWDLLGTERFGREDVVVALGGGATTDVAGFVAASWLRGVRLVNVPTTLLAMVDAAVGGKTGINTAAGKNLVGAFHPPAGVVCDLTTLATLPAGDLRAGLAEVIKAGFIADPQILRLVEADGGTGARTPGSAVLRELVERAVAVKARVVSEDLREQGLREILNYGHTFAHAIERTEGYRWRHGDAVAVGMVFAAELAHATGILDAAGVQRHRELLTMVGLPVRYEGGTWPELLEAMTHDKKVRGNALRFVLLEDIGRPTVLRAPELAHLEQAYARVRASA
ncbi:3-dehydroquinate synthase [Georgenia yuyongxinii]|uniref:Multifunctional fusion protein n=1 Tax=Georgenia yuyongxinii TaxID=2589797 RepID=A0A5B8C6D7_9MICO|nr:3-dehydroquinate synthase [Georgenia yuyongxinii]